MTPRRALGLVLLPVAEWVDALLHDLLPAREWMPCCHWCRTLDAWAVGW